LFITFLGYIYITKLKSRKEVTKTVGIKVFLISFLDFRKELDPEPDLYLVLLDLDPDPGGPKTSDSMVPDPTLVSRQ
jgi:hypothetical protein